MPRMKTIHDHLDLYWQFYAASFAILVFVVLGLQFRESRRQEAAQLTNWPVTKARIVDSTVHEVSSGGKNGPATTLIISLKLSYVAMNQRYDISYTRSWKRADDLDYASMLAVGNEIEIRYKPSDPCTISLHPTVPL